MLPTLDERHPPASKARHASSSARKATRLVRACPVLAGARMSILSIAEVEGLLGSFMRKGAAGGFVGDELLAGIIAKGTISLFGLRATSFERGVRAHCVLVLQPTMFTRAPAGMDHPHAHLLKVLDADGTLHVFGRHLFAVVFGGSVFRRTGWTRGARRRALGLDEYVFGGDARNAGAFRTWMHGQNSSKGWPLESDGRSRRNKPPRGQPHARVALEPVADRSFVARRKHLGAFRAQLQVGGIRAIKAIPLACAAETVHTSKRANRVGMIRRVDHFVGKLVGMRQQACRSTVLQHAKSLMVVQTSFVVALAKCTLLRAGVAVKRKRKDVHLEMKFDQDPGDLRKAPLYN